MQSLIFSLKIAHADTISLGYKLMNYRWNIVDENTDSLREFLLNSAQALLSAVDLIGEHVRGLSMPNSPNFHNLLSFITIDIDSMIPVTVNDKLQSAISANNSVIQNLTTLKVAAQEANALDTVILVDTRIAYHQSLASQLSSFLGN